MIRFLFPLGCCLLCLSAFGQVPDRGQIPEKDLPYYIETAKTNSPLLNDYRNQTAIRQAERQRLKAFYTHSRLELQGDYLFVPIISQDGGKTAFLWNAQEATDYYGYDLGESSGHLHAGLQWTQPLLGYSAYKVAKEQTEIQTAITNNDSRLENHRLERIVTEQYLLCRLDMAQIAFTDSLTALLDRQTDILRKRVENGLSKQSDLHLLLIEQTANREQHTAALQSYQSHLMELNLLCGIEDTSLVALPDPAIFLNAFPNATDNSLFVERYRLDSLNTAASLKEFNLQYKPQLNLILDAGLQIGDFHEFYRHFGWSAGLSFSWTIADGKQRKYKRLQADHQWNTITAYRTQAEKQRSMRIRQCLMELEKNTQRQQALEQQRDEYDQVLMEYTQEMKVGQVSIVEYLMVLQHKTAVEKELLVLQTNRQQIIVAYNYWNW